MATISSFYGFDTPFLNQLPRIQRQVNHSIPAGMFALLNSFQQNVQFSSDAVTSPLIQTLNALNSIQSAEQLPQIKTIVQNVQRVYDTWTPAMQTIINQQSQIQAMATQLENTMLGLIESSCADLTRDARMSALATALDSFTSLDVFADESPVETPELTDEESTQLAVEISEAVEDQQNWQQRLMAVIQAWNERNPVAAYVIQLLVAAILSQLISSLFKWGATALKDSVIREEPTSKATAVCQVKQGETITIIGDVPYYYLIEINDPDADEYLSGYISKKSVKSTQTDSE